MYLKSVNPANPLKYYDDLQDHLINEYYKEFVEEAGYNKERDAVYYYYDTEEGYSYDVYLSFEDKITPFLKYNNRKIIDFIYRKMAEIKTFPRQVAYLDQVLSEVQRLYGAFLNGSLRSKALILRQLQVIEDEINLKIKPFLSFEGPENIKKYGTLDNSKGGPIIHRDLNMIKSYKWIGRKLEKQLLLMYALLTKYEIIDQETDFNLFVYAFNNQSLQDELKIKWLIKTKNGKDANKSSLHYFISKLIDFHLIENNCDKNENTRISLIFCDHEGRPFKNLKQSKYDSAQSAQPIGSRVIDMILGQIKSL